MARSASSGACVCDSLMTTVFAFGAEIDLIAVTRKPQPPLSLRARLIDQTASWAVTGVPSENLALRRLNVYVSLSAEMVQLVARSGTMPVPVAFGATRRL